MKAKRILLGAVIASKKFGLRPIRAIVTSVKHSSRLLFSDKLLLYTNTGLSVGLSVAGDIVQQKSKCLKGENVKDWDKKRTVQMAASGLAVGPVVHYWYLYLDRWFPGRNAASLIKKVILDQIVLSPIYITLFIVTIGALEGQPWTLMKEEFKTTGVAMLISDILVWTPAQTVNFYFLPTRFRVLFDSSVSLAMDVWFSYLRFDRHSTSKATGNGSHKDCCTSDCDEADCGSLESVEMVKAKDAKICKQSTHHHLQAPEGKTSSQFLTDSSLSVFIASSS
ncbi:mpv17-like protein 2 [Plakobranchus ocellatus]|uniref:Mpv17-like protein 2 n=1 Tax=Plakobranchus ocellatus TaxID=259542 RepID=A0AAV4B7A3_9GAST|nr:mpv17-like protein 2 [Plakobranchus ocellatus]